MDRSADEIVFTKDGCNFCEQAIKALKDIEYTAINIPKSKGQYDCLIGLSGGVDSSTVLHYAVKMGLRPMCFTLDNGWNSKESDENVLKMVEKLKVPLYRYSIDRKKFTKLQSAFMHAGVKNIEIPTDHVLMAVSYELADKYGIRTILSGGNVSTESIMPPSWGYNARDLTHIKEIYKRFTGNKLTGLPTCSLLKWNYYRWIKGIKVLYPLDAFDYNRETSIEVLKDAYGYVPYGDKHCESTFTTWFQNFYLYEKFGIDKRKAHLSSLIVSGQMTREEALNKLTESPVYPELGLEKKVLKYPKHEHSDYPQDKWYERIAWFINLWKF